MSGVAVCIVTFRRPALLERLLLDLRPQLETQGASVVVVDNDLVASARDAVERARAAGVPVTYEHEPRPGIPVARNTAVRAACAAFVAFTDDDVRPAAGWLDALVERQRATDADVVTGPVRFVFPDGEPSWARGAHCFRTRSDEGADASSWPATNNVLIRRSAMVERGVWFDESYGMAGGSDTQLFRRLAREGATFAWAEDAIVDELVPPDRARPGWAIRRSYRTGNTATLCEVELSGRRAAAVPTLRSAARWWWWALRSAAAAATRRDPAAAVRAASSVARAIGLVSGLAGRRYEEYRRA